MPFLDRFPALSRAALILAATIGMMFWRRPDQFRAPYIWVEGGTISLVQYIVQGVGYLASPVAGYLILPSKLIQLAALSLSLDWFPELAFALTILFTAAVLCAIALSPTTLRWPLASALFLLLVPSDSEVYGTSHYAFWWGTLLLLPPLLWPRSDDRSLWPRIAMVVLGGLSSPLVVALLPVFALHAAVARTRNTTLVGAAALGCAAIQLGLLELTGALGTATSGRIDVQLVVAKFFGMFVHWSPRADDVPSLSLALGLALIALLVLAACAGAKQLAWRHVVLVLGLGASILVSLARMPVEAMHPVLSGPRYFFYPFVFLGWLAIELLPVARPRIAGPLALCLAASLHQVVAYGPRGHDTIDWRAELARCEQATGAYQLPVHTDGDADELWHAEIPPGGCRDLGDRSLLH